MRTVLITGARSPAALDVARDYAASGYEVHMADSAPARISRWSNAPARVHRVRPPVGDAQGFRRDVSRIVEEVRPELVIPTCEEVFHLSAARDAGVDVGRLFAPDMETLDVLHAKDRFAAMATGLGIDVPETILLNGRAKLDTIDTRRHVLKACYSRFGEGTRIRPDARSTAGVRPTPERPWIAQRHVDGVEHSSYAIAVEGRVTLFSAYRSTMRLGGGAGYAFAQAGPGVARRMRESTIRIASALGITGQISLDAIDDGDRTWLIECNPRATSGIHLVAGGGRIVRAMSGEHVDDDGTRGACHNLPMMIAHGMLRSPGCWKAVRRGRDVIGAPADRWPMAGAIADTVGYAIDAIRHGTSMTGATTRDIEWNGTR